jgi:IPT/TIG domain/NHL repeat
MKKISLLILISIILIESCSKDSSNPAPVIQAPLIYTISPTHGPFNTTVIISGSNFSTTASQNVVKFNGVLVTVTNATAIQLTVNVPTGVGTGNVSVKVNGQEVSGPLFTYEYAGIVSTVAGAPASGVFQYPSGVAVDDQDNIYVADMLANQIKKITPTGVVSVLAGSGSQGFTNGVGTTAKFNYPWAVKCDAQGNVYVCDMYNNSIRKVTATGVVTTIAGDGIAGFINGQGTATRFDHPTGLTFDATGNIYIADSYNARIRKITPAGLVSTVIFNPNSTQPAASHGLLVDTLGSIFGCDQVNHRIMKFTTDGGWIEYGYGAAGFFDGHYSFARFNGPSDIIADRLGNMYVADAANGAIRKIAVDGYVSTVAGNGTRGFVDGAGSEASFRTPLGLAIDKHGNLFVADATNRVIRKIVFQ